MRTLREIGDFEGLPQDSPEFGAFSVTSLRLAGLLLARGGFGDDGQRASMRGVNELLDTLVPISLQANLKTAGGTEPIDVVVALTPSPGLILSTRITFVRADGAVFGGDKNFGNAAGDKDLGGLGPGTYHVVVKRAGIANDGYKVLQQSFPIQVNAAPSPPAPHTPRAPVPPHIAASSSGAASAVTLHVTGTGFLPSQPANNNGITIRVVDAMNPLQGFAPPIFVKSDTTGAIDATLDAFDSTQLAVNPISGKTGVAVSATDSRKNPNSVSTNEPLWSNTVTIFF